MFRDVKGYFEKRVSDLLEANNRYLERARSAEHLLLTAMSTFRKYEGHHLAKNTPESLVKAKENADFADLIEKRLRETNSL
jgi:hypothetical protein